MESSQKTEPSDSSEAEAYTNTLNSSSSSSASASASASSSEMFSSSPIYSSSPLAPSQQSQQQQQQQQSLLTPIDIPIESKQSTTTTEETISTPDITISESSSSMPNIQPTPTESTLYDQPIEPQYQPQEETQPQEEPQYQPQEEYQPQEKYQPQEEPQYQPEEEPQYQPEEETQPEEESQPEEEYQPEEELPTIPAQQEITQEEYEEIKERELSLRSKILNQPLPCQKKQPPNNKNIYIEKIQLKTPLTENEATISRQIKEQCPQAFLYFQPLIETTPLQTNTITDCEEGTEQQPNPTDELIETKYKKTGTIPLTQFLKSHIATQKQKNKFIQLLVHTHLQLLNAIQTLQSLDPPIIHFHLTPETLQYNTIDATPVITDFRLAFTRTTLENPQENKDLFPPYENIPSYPFEVFLLSKLTDQEEETPLDPPSLTQISEAFAQQTNMAAPKNTIQYEKTPTEIRKKAMTHHLTWDPYAVHQYIYSFMTRHQIPIDKPFMTQYKDLLVSYLTVEPGQRPSIQTTQENIKNIFKSVPKKDYLGFIASLTDLQRQV